MKKKLTGLVAALSAVLFMLGTATPANAVPPSAAWQQIVTLQTGMCATAGGNGELIQYRCDNKRNKQFSSAWAGTDAYFLRVYSSFQCVAPSSAAEYANIVQVTCSNTDLQVWEAEFQGNDSYRLRNRATGMCLTVAWDVTASGQPLNQSRCGAFAAQTWRFRNM
ncbi:RICIN domain-containing protein [Streptomyces sp. ACA25]|uniref:RICIN domain-containing protein n=1 Tax=Streptomyces sp. ACA25 TaxID=3022596 RepID=UPI002307DC9D|nr:RICIN domain-containing protein [Streptomyces sp. ACA25]MDB1088564.1 RICIN domain-containing protein [Streptomyces sp. ACA25]